MCGIIGYLGNPINPEATFDLTEQLLIKTETRGFNATGFWGVEGTPEGAVYYDKEAVKASEYVKGNHWKNLKDKKLNLFIAHCRQSSIMGSEKTNRNNHPHVSDDFRIALVHNGKIPEYSSLKGRYEHNTECDSEILLRMFESSEMIPPDEKTILPGLDQNVALRLVGIKEIFSRINLDHAMAVAIGERHDHGARSLWLFKDDKRPLYFADLRETLGQIFFFSTAAIFGSAYEECTIAKKYIPLDLKIAEIPDYQAWCLQINATGDFKYQKIEINKSKTCTEIEEDLIKIQRPPMKDPLMVVSRLNEKEEIIIGFKNSTNTSEVKKVEVVEQAEVPPTEKKKVSSVIENSSTEAEYDWTKTRKNNSWSKEDLQLEKKKVIIHDLTSVRDTLSRIDVVAGNLHNEGTIDDEQIDFVLSSIADCYFRLTSIANISDGADDKKMNFTHLERAVAYFHQRINHIERTLGNMDIDSWQDADSIENIATELKGTLRLLESK